jgi:hypothetical protein
VRFRCTHVEEQADYLTSLTPFAVRRSLKRYTRGAHSDVRGKRDPLARRIKLDLVATKIDLKTTFRKSSLYPGI